MSKLSLINLNKTYHNGAHALKDFSLDINDHEFVVVLGKSGCGKTTLLRMISGLDNPDSGEILMDNEIINDVDPTKRDVAMVFQSYALYPQMTAYQNLSIPLRTKLIRKQLFDKKGNPILSPNYQKIEELKKQIEQSSTKDEKKQLKNKIKELKNNPTEPTFDMLPYTPEEIDQKVREVANQLDITPFLDQRASTLSGGQKQRVALGKAMVRAPKVLLMDEPLSNLDTKLKNQALSLIQKVHHQCNAITIYVTHDQNESMSLADKLVVMKDGYIQQVGTPLEVFNNPKNIFVATFLGTPPINIIELDELKTKESLIGIRPENISINPIENGIEIPVICEYCELLGHDLYCYSQFKEQRIIIKLPDRTKIETEQEFKIYIDPNKILYFNKETGERIY